MRWVFLALYLVIIAAVSVPFWSAYEIEAIYWWLGLAGLMLGCQALFIFGSGTMHLCRPIRKRRLWMPAPVLIFAWQPDRFDRWADMSAEIRAAVPKV